ncbi:hypothetical protein [Streptomyces sp. NPDC050164]|uniref:hypothetical protein n=1 Tax=Streptomyces sp. NPDC050164 TaxID=3365605 RepID=UPI00378CBCD3
MHDEDPFALVSYCRAITVSLHATAEAAEAQKGFIDDLACGGACCRNHHIIRLADPHARMTSSKGGAR